MRQTSEEHNNEHCNNGQSLHWELVLNAPIWVLEPHRALECEPSAFRADAAKHS